MTLPADVARCGGVWDDCLPMAECLHCYRRTAPPIEYCSDYHCAGDCGLPHNEKELRYWWMSPPEFVSGKCPSRMEEPK